jgi:Fur family transcriptional regulator, ferric uptake regulator
MTVSDVHDLVAQRLHADGQRYTTGRRALVDVLSHAGQPLTIPEILDGAEGFPQSSAYRNLAVLERAGVVVRLVTADEFGRYELAEELTGHHHHHLVCERCGIVLDVELPPSVERALDRALDSVGTTYGFRVEHHRLDLVGRCAACR